MNTLMKLYEAAAEYSFLVEQDELTESDIQKLDDVVHTIEVKASNIAALTDSMSSFVDMCKAEEVRIANKRRAIENRIKWVNDYLKNNMEAAGIMEIEVGTRKIALQRNPAKCVVDNENDVPPKYFTIIPESFQLNKNMLRADLKKMDVPGAHLEQSLSLRKR